MPSILKLVQKTAEEGTFPNSSYNATITLIPKPDRENKTKHYMPISVVNIDVKILKKNSSKKNSTAY